MPFLRFSTPAMGTQLVPIRDLLTIGRGKECQLVLDDGNASRRHCQIRRVGNDYMLEDLKSKNGTMVNGTLINSQKLSDGDLIGVGNHALVYKVHV